MRIDHAAEEKMIMNPFSAASGGSNQTFHIPLEHV
jgi:hypothetical protein